jgi:hypothetical protein
VTFVAWVRARLVPHLRRGDVVLLDNLKAHKAPDVRVLIEAAGATLRYLPPHSHDFNPIEAAWGLIKKRIRTYAPRTAAALRRRRPGRAARHPAPSLLAVVCPRQLLSGSSKEVTSGIKILPSGACSLGRCSVNRVAPADGRPADV